jgi:hypothetical protein
MLSHVLVGKLDAVVVVGRAKDSHTVPALSFGPPYRLAPPCLTFGHSDARVWLT